MRTGPGSLRPRSASTMAVVLERCGAAVRGRSSTSPALRLARVMMVSEAKRRDLRGILVTNNDDKLRMRLMEEIVTEMMWIVLGL